MEITLDKLCLGQKGIVTQIDTDTHMQCRLRDFGLVPGTQVYCRYRTPSGSVTAVEFRGSVVALRTRDLHRILVES